MKEVGQDTLERWTIRKAKVIKKKSKECKLYTVNYLADSNSIFLVCFSII